jgi:hypothetical protein
MERGRAWRRFKSDCYFLKRIKRRINGNYYIRIYWGSFPIQIYNPTWMDKISSKEVVIYKSIRTTKQRSRHKVKWGKKGRKNFDWSFDPNTRPKSKSRFLKELRDYGY